MLSVAFSALKRTLFPKISLKAVVSCGVSYGNDTSTSTACVCSRSESVFWAAENMDSWEICSVSSDELVILDQLASCLNDCNIINNDDTSI